MSETNWQRVGDGSVVWRRLADGREESRLYSDHLADGGATLSAPNVPGVQSVTRFQAKAALALAGKLDAAQAIVDASTDPLVKLAWNEVATFERQSPMLNAMAPALWPEDTDAELDALFAVAAGIVA